VPHTPPPTISTSTLSAAAPGLGASGEVIGLGTVEGTATESDGEGKRLVFCLSPCWRSEPDPVTRSEGPHAGICGSHNQRRGPQTIVMESSLAWRGRWQERDG
jgi:hypothetical protein